MVSGYPQAAMKNSRFCCWTICVLLAALVASGSAEEAATFVSIHKVEGDRIHIGQEETAGRGRRGGRGRAPSPQLTVITVPKGAMITAAMREQRTFKFRVMGELAGGLRHRVFRNLSSPLAARMVTRGGRITEINVITSATDLNQSNVDSDGKAVIAVRPKRPPAKKK